MRPLYSLAGLSLSACLAFPSAVFAQNSNVNVVDAGVQPIGYLPPTHEGSVRLLIRALSSHGEDGQPLSQPPRVRAHVGSLQIGCEDNECRNGGVLVQSVMPDELDPLHLGIVVDDTLALGRGRKLSEDICAGIRSTALSNAAYSTWRIADSTGSARLGGTTRDVDAVCSQLEALEGRIRDARSPILQVLDEALSTMASDTQHGTRRELLVITDGNDETCIGSADVDRCADDLVLQIRARAIANSIPISVLLVDASRSGSSVALHQGTRIRRLGAETAGVVRSIRLQADASAFRALLQDELRAIDSVAYATVECVSAEINAPTVDLRLSKIEGEGSEERIASVAARSLASAPLACATQRELCGLTGALCAPDDARVNRIEARQNGRPIPADDVRDADNAEADAATHDVEEDSNTNWIGLLLILALILVAAAVLVTIFRRFSKKRARDESEDEPSFVAASPLPSSVDSADTNFTAVEGAGTGNAYNSSWGASDATSVEWAAPPAHAQAPVRRLSPLGKLRSTVVHQDGRYAVALTSSGHASVVPLVNDDWTRIAVDPNGSLSVARGNEAQVLLRYDTGANVIHVRLGNGGDGVLHIRRERASEQGGVVNIGDVIHVGMQRTPIEIRFGASGIAGHALLIPEGADMIRLPEITIGYDECVIGRDPEPDPGWEDEFVMGVRLPLDGLAEAQRRRVSSDHVSVWITGGHVVLRDLSSNGTLVNGQRIPTHLPFVLRDGDQVRISHEIAYRVKISS